VDIFRGIFRSIIEGSKPRDDSRQAPDDAAH